MSGLDPEFNELFLESFKNICRVCLSSQDVLIPVDEIYFSQLNDYGSFEGLNIRNVLKKYCNIQVHANDSKPSNFCKPCINMVYQAYSIFEKFIESNKTLDSLIREYKEQETVSVGRETVSDTLNDDNPPTISLIDSEEEEEEEKSLVSEEEEESGGFAGHEDSVEYEQDVNNDNPPTVSLIDTEEEEEESADFTGHGDNNKYNQNKTLSTQSQSENSTRDVAYSSYKKHSASFNSAENSLRNHNSSEENQAEVIILVPEDKTPDFSDLQSFIKIVASDDNEAEAGDHTYSRDNGTENVKRKPTEKMLVPGAKKQKTSSSTNSKAGPIQKFSEFKCNVCEDVLFDDIEKVIEHIKEIHPSSTKCIMCPRVLHQPESMIIHVAFHSEYGQFTCKKCLVICKSEEALQEHRASAAHKAPFSCDTCGKLFTLRATWRYHNQVIHKQGTKRLFQCWVCGLVLKWARNYKGHLRSHKIYPQDKSHLCEFCARGFYDSTTLQKHIRNVHKKGRGAGNDEKKENSTTYQCEYCPKMFTTKASFFGHRVSHPECDNIECRYCDKVLSNLQDYKEHKQTEHSSFICDVCEKGFPNKGTLTAHRSLHRGNFKCRYCDATFQTRQRRIIHEYVHTDERPHQCKICGSRFKQSNQLDRHTECMHTTKRFVCKLCGQGCQFECNYKNHLRSHTGVKPFTCPYCLKSFRDTIIRHRHVKREHPEQFQDFLLYKKEHQDKEVRRAESQPDKLDTEFVNAEEGEAAAEEEEAVAEEEAAEEENMFSAVLSSEDDDDYSE